ncbi:MAG: hypothetical protein V1914_02040 [archaeon]
MAKLEKLSLEEIVRLSKKVKRWEQIRQGITPEFSGKIPNTSLIVQIGYEIPGNYTLGCEGRSLLSQNVCDFGRYTYFNHKQIRKVYQRAKESWERYGNSVFEKECLKQAMKLLK